MEGHYRWNEFFHFQAPPSIINDDDRTNIEIKLGGNLILKCQTSGTPKPTIQWFHNNQSLTISHTKEEYTLENVEQHHEGVYRCLATNNIGSVDRYFNVSIHSEDSFLLIFEHIFISLRLSI